MNDLVIYGAGGLGRELLEIIEEINKEGGDWRILGFADDGLEKGTTVCGYPVLGGFDFFRSRAGSLGIVFGFADCALKETLYYRIKELCPGFYFPVIIHPSSYVSSRAALAEGVVIARFCVVNVNANVGKCVLINENSGVYHDCVVGDFVSIMPAVRISGNVSVGKSAYIGVQAAIRQGLAIGSGSVVGMGSVVIKDVPDGCTVVGNPAKIIRGQEKTP